MSCFFLVLVDLSLYCNTFRYSSRHVCLSGSGPSADYIVRHSGIHLMFVFQALVAQLNSPNEDLRQVAASVLRNLSWRADLASKKTLREVGAVVALMKAALEVCSSLIH